MSGNAESGLSLDLAPGPAGEPDPPLEIVRKNL